MSPETNPDALPAAGPRNLLGRLLPVVFLAFFLMVALGIFWVWQKSAREKAWRDRVNAAETFLVPPPSPR